MEFHEISDIISGTSISKIVYDIRRKEFLRSNKGFIHEVLNLCCKYNAIDIWNGTCRRKGNPMLWIKKIVCDFNLSSDLSVGRKTACSFSAQFLKNPFIYQKKYQILEPFRKLGQFHSTDARKRFHRALLETSKFLRPCSHCGSSFYDLLQHQLFSCKGLAKMRATLLTYLHSYKSRNLPYTLSSKHAIMAAALKNKNILLAFSNFLDTVQR